MSGLDLKELRNLREQIFHLNDTVGLSKNTFSEIINTIDKQIEEIQI